MTTEILEIPQSSFLRRLVETGRAKLPLAGDVLIFDPGFWKYPLTWKVPFVNGYVPTLSVFFALIPEVISITMKAQIGAKIISSLVKINEAMVSIPVNPQTIDSRLLFVSAAIGFFSTISVTNLCIAYKYFGVTKKDIEHGPFPFSEFVRISQNTPELDKLPVGNLLKMILSGFAYWDFIQKVRRREKGYKTLNWS